MENKESFFKRLEPFTSPRELALVKTAYIFSKYARCTQSCKGIRYFEHPKRVAIILMDEFRTYDPHLVCLALLHDCFEVTDDFDIHVIQHVFGCDMARNVRVLTKDDSDKDAYYERLEFASPATRIIKFCDRIDNLRNLLATNDPGFIERKLDETRDYLLCVPVEESPTGIGIESRAKMLLDEVWRKTCSDFDKLRVGMLMQASAMSGNL